MMKINSCYKCMCMRTWTEMHILAKRDDFRFGFSVDLAAVRNKPQSNQLIEPTHQHACLWSQHVSCKLTETSTTVIVKACPQSPAAAAGRKQNSAAACGCLSTYVLQA